MKQVQSYQEISQHDWESFFQARAAYKEASSKFTGRPPLPMDTQTTEGGNVFVYTMPALSNGTTGRAGSRTA